MEQALGQITSEPRYRADINGLAEELRRAHGPAALDVAAETARQHLKSSAWKSCALWLQIVNHLNGGPSPSLS